MCNVCMYVCASVSKQCTCAWCIYVGESYLCLCMLKCVACVRIYSQCSDICACVSGVLFVSVQILRANVDVKLRMMVCGMSTELLFI